MGADPRAALQVLGSEEELRPTRAALPEAKHLPPHYYTSADILELEKQKLFFKDWLVVGRVEEWAKPGDYKALEFFDEPVVICRNEAGELGAFANVCRHRGVAVAIGEGNAKDFRCPYHAWVYDLSGKLVAASRPRGIKLREADGRLPPIRIDTWGGFVFINFDPEAPPLNQYLDADGYRDSVAYVHPQDTVLVDTYTYELDCNWKLVPENLADVYHVEVIHRSSFGGKTYSPEKALAELVYTKYGWYKEYISGTMAPDAELLFGPAPWLADHPKGKLFAFSAFLRPNFYLFARADIVQPWVAYPLGPNRTRVTGWTCLPKEFAGAPAFQDKVAILARFARKFAGEDSDLVRAIQKGLTSRYFVPGPMHEMEGMIHHRINRYLDALHGGGEVT
jgi:Rieske 2Fe-2S family protein